MGKRITVVVLLLTTLFVVLAMFIFRPFISTFFQEDELLHYEEMFDHDEWVIVLEGQIYAQALWGDDDQLLISATFIKEHIDPYLYWDESIAAYLITTDTEQKIVPIEADVIVQSDEATYFKLDFIHQTYGLDHYLNHTKQVLSILPDVPKAVWTAAETSKVFKQRASENYVAELREQDVFFVLAHENDWLFIQFVHGYAGYVLAEQEDFELIVDKQVIDGVDSEPEVEKHISLLWDGVYRQTESLGWMPSRHSVNVLSPTWFHLVDEDGTLEDLGSLTYAQWTKDNDIQLWALVSNNFEPDITNAMLRNYHARQNMIEQLIQFAHKYDLDGLNVDFENVYLANKADFVQFMRELAIQTTIHDLVLSVDVTIHSTNEMWSMFYDRPALAETVDYVALMTYDEHWAASPVAGSVASLPWVEQGLIRILEEVPHDKLLLGMPFYARLWTIATDEEGTERVSSQSFSMLGVQNWIEERNAEMIFDDHARQNFVRWQGEDEHIRYKLWVEDEISVRERLKLVHKYNLKGVAIWEKRFATDHIWDVFEEMLHIR